MAEKSPGKYFTPQVHKGKPSEPVPHHPHSSADAALGASTGVLEANLQIRELGQAKTFPLTAPGTGICQGLGRIRARREMPRLVRGWGHGWEVEGAERCLCRGQRGWEGWNQLQREGIKA